MTKLSRRWLYGVAIFAVAQWRIFFSALIRHWHSWCCSGKLLRLRQVTWKCTCDNPTLVRSQRGPKMPLIDQGWKPLSRWWPFGAAIFAVAQWRDFLSLICHWQSWCCSGKLLRLRQLTWKSTDDNLILVRSQRGPKGPLIDQGRRPLWQSYLGGGPLE